MRIKVSTFIMVIDGPKGEPKRMEFEYECDYTPNPRYWAHAIQCATGTAAQLVGMSLDPKVDLQIGQEPSSH